MPSFYQRQFFARTFLAAALVLGAGAAHAATTTVNLTVRRASVMLPDGNTVPMWGYCTDDATTTATNAALGGGALLSANPKLPGSQRCNTAAVAPALPAPITAWVPGPIIVVPVGNTLTINLTNNLPTPTSIVILGQLGGGLGLGTKEPSPQHNGQSMTTWPANADATFTPQLGSSGSPQPDRVRSFGTEVASGAAAVPLIWGDVATLKPGTYLYETGTHPSIQAPMGLYGVLVVTNNAVSPNVAYPATGGNAAVAYDADQVMLFSEADLVQNALVDAAAVGTAGCTPITGACTGTIDESKYPAAVNYAPTYFFVNGSSYDVTNPAVNQFVLNPPAKVSGRLLLRWVNAGSRTHIPSVVNLPMTLIAEDGNVLPGIPKVQNEVLLTAGKSYDTTIAPLNSAGTAYASQANGFFDRALALSVGNQPNGGLQGQLLFGGSAAVGPAAALCAGVSPTFTVPLGSLTYSASVLVNPAGVSVVGLANLLATGAANPALTLNSSGAFKYTFTTPLAAGASTSFSYQATCTSTGANVAGTVTLTAAALATNPIVLAAKSYTASNSSSITVPHGAGLLIGATSDYPLSINTTQSFGTSNCGTLTVNADGSFQAVGAPTGTCTFSYVATDSQGTSSAANAVTVIFPAGNGPAVTVVDAQSGATIADYRWIIEQDTTFHTPAGTTPVVTNGVPAQTLATNFHSSHMPVIATGCTGPKSCRTDAAYQQVLQGVAQPGEQAVDPTQVALDTSKYYFISVMTGDAGDPFASGYTDGDCQGPSPNTAAPCGHSISGAPIAPPTAGNVFSPVTVKAEPTPQQPAQLSVMVYEDSNPVNGALDGEEEANGLGGFEIVLTDPAGRTGDPAGQVTYDVNNMPVTNALFDTFGWVVNTDLASDNDVPGQWVNLCPSALKPKPADGVQPSQPLIGVIYTCPDGSALAGQAIIKNVEPGRYDVTIRPGAARIAASTGPRDVWLQSETLEGTPAQDAFAKVNEPTYFQEFGPPGPHTTVGFVNPSHIDAINKTLSGTKHTITGQITNMHMSRPSDVRLWDSKSREPLSASTCFVALNSTGGTGQAVAFAYCDANGNFTLTGVPAGQYQLAIWDEWLDQIFSFKAVTVASSPATVAMGTISVFSWFTRVETNTFLDQSGSHFPPCTSPCAAGQDPKNLGIAQIPVVIRYRDGSISSRLSTDSAGSASFNELFPLFNWYVIESDTTRFKSNGADIWVDAGGPTDTTGLYAGIIGSKYIDGTSTHRYDAPAKWANPLLQGTRSMETEGIQGFVSQTVAINWAKVPYKPGENGGITGVVAYASTRAFDDPRMFVQNIWEPLVPNVTVNLYQEGTASDGVTPTLKLINTTQTSSWDAYAGGTDNLGNPLMSCPGQNPADPFVTYTVGLANLTKCFDGFRTFNQAQPAPYSGRYSFTTDANGVALQPGKYVVEMVPPTGYEVVKEEDKNILIGDAWIAPPAEQFGGLSNIFILPDQAVLANANLANPNQNNPTTNLGTDRADVAHPACVGTVRQVPDYLAFFPNAQQVAPFAGAMKPLCDRKEVALEDQLQANADFALFTQVQIAAHFTGMILDDAASEFNPASPAFGEKFAVPFDPISIRDWNGIEINRMTSDQFGMYNGLAPSSWEVNVPNPAGFSPNMLVTCMNDPGPVNVGGKMVTDPNFNRMYSNFCYTLPFMPGLTSYLDTPVVPTAAFASGYDPVDCDYPNYTPAIGRVDGNWTPSISHVHGSPAPSGPVGPYLVTNNNKPMTLTITAAGDTQVLNPAYIGPTGNTAPFNAKKITRHYGFGSSGTAKIGNTVLTCTWSDLLLNCTVPNGTKTGQLTITAANGKSTIDAVTVTIENPSAAGYREPQYIAPGSSIQAVVDGILDRSTGTAHANYATLGSDSNKLWPGDMIMLDAGSYNELVVLWMPVRLQGVGANSTIINAAKYPTEKLEGWRKEVNLLFLGSELPAIGTDTPLNRQVDPLPGQEIADTILAMEPVVLADAEGAGITVLGQPDCRQFDSPPLNQAGGFGGCPTKFSNRTGAGGYGNYVMDAAGNLQQPLKFLGNFSYRDPAHKARIDGLTVTGGDSAGAIFVDGWAHNEEISNNRIYGNAGVYAGGVRIGQPFLEDAAGGPLNFNMNVAIHNNAITTNGALESNYGDGGAGGGLSISSGADNFLVDRNFVCGNNTEDSGGGIGVIGVSTNGKITHNQILFNEAFNPTTTQNGGGIAIEGEPANNGGTDAGTDTIAPTYGTGSILVDSNQIVGNFAKGGHGGGIWLQDVNGDDVVLNRNRKSSWYRVTVTNNFIADNVAGWSGGGIALQDTLNSVIEHNTIVHNDSTATAGAVFVSGLYANYGSAYLSSHPVNQTQSGNWPAGVSSLLHSADMSTFLVAANVPANLRSTYSDPTLVNDIIWGNRSFYFSTTPPAVNTPGNPTYGLTTQLNPVLTQTSNGQCVAGETDWDVGVVGFGPADVEVDTGEVGAGEGGSTANPTLLGYGPQDGGATHTLHPRYSVMTQGSLANTAAYGSSNLLLAPTDSTLLTKTYCNGSRVPLGVPNENAQIPPFQMVATSAEDEGGNFVDVRYGPLSLNDLLIGVTSTDGGNSISENLYGDYHLPSGSPAIDAGTLPSPLVSLDYYGTSRPQGKSFDIGAHEVLNTAQLSNAQVSPAPLDFGLVYGGSSLTLVLTLSNSGSATLSGITISALGGPNAGDFAILSTGSANTGTGSCFRSSGLVTQLLSATSCTINVQFKPLAAGARTASFTLAGQLVTLTGTGTPRLDVTPTTISLSHSRSPASPAALVKVSQTVTVKAPGFAGTMNAPALSGSGNFSITGNTCTGAVAAAGSCTFNVVFTVPRSRGTSNGTLTVTGTNGTVVTPNDGVNFSVGTVPVTGSAN